MKRRDFLKLAIAGVVALAVVKMAESDKAQAQSSGELSFPASFPIAFATKRPLPIWFTFAPLVSNGD